MNASNCSSTTVGKCGYSYLIDPSLSARSSPGTKHICLFLLEWRRALALELRVSHFVSAPRDP